MKTKDRKPFPTVSFLVFLASLFASGILVLAAAVFRLWTVLYEQVQRGPDYPNHKSWELGVIGQFREFSLVVVAAAICLLVCMGWLWLALRRQHTKESNNSIQRTGANAPVADL